MAQSPAARGPLFATARELSPGFPQLFFSSGKTARKHRSAAGLDVQNALELEFVCHFNNHFNPSLGFLHVVEIKTFSFSAHSSLYRNR